MFFGTQSELVFWAIIFLDFLLTESLFCQTIGAWYGNLKSWGKVKLRCLRLLINKKWVSLSPNCEKLRYRGHESVINVWMFLHFLELLCDNSERGYVSGINVWFFCRCYWCCLANKCVQRTGWGMRWHYFITGEIFWMACLLQLWNISSLCDLMWQEWSATETDSIACINNNYNRHSRRGQKVGSWKSVLLNFLYIG